MAARSFLRHRLVLATGLAAALPVVVSTVHAVAAGWLPLGDDAIIAVRSYDVLSTHPPLLGPYSTSSLLIGKPVLSPGPLLFWLLALPVRLGEAAPAIAMGIVNTCAVVGVVALARRRGGRPLMFATAAAVAATCGSLDAATLHDVWGPSAAVLPFMLLIFLAWSLACGEYRLLPLTALVASFTVQSHLTYVLPGATLLAIALGLLAASRPRIPRRWLAGTLAVVVVCWSFPVAEEAVHRPGNFERIAQAATVGKPTFGASAGWHSVVRAVGMTPWWLEGPRAPFTRLAEVSFAPSALSTVTASLALAALAGVALAGLRSRRREAAAGALLALGLSISVAVVAASIPKALFAVVSYTLWWASPAGMFSWLVLGFAAVAFAGGAHGLRAVRSRLSARAARVRAVPGTASAVGVLGVAAVGALVAAGGEPDRIENAFDPARTIVARVRAATPRGGAILVEGSSTELGFDLQGAVAYGLRGAGAPFVVSSLPGIGTRYDPARRAPEWLMEVVERPPAGRTSGRVIARVVLADVPADGRPSNRARRTLVVTLAPARAGSERKAPARP